MRPMDKITVRLRPSNQQPGMTQLHLSGLITTRLDAKSVRRLWQLIEQLSEESCVVLPADAPLSWFDLWYGRLAGARTSRLRIRLMQPRNAVFGVVDAWVRRGDL